MDIISNLPEWIQKDLEDFRREHTVDDAMQYRLAEPQIPYFGDEVLTMAIAALLQGENILLSGSKATGKNILAENLAYLFGRPLYNISFHVNTDASSLIGTDTFKDQEVQLRHGPVYQCALYGGFGVLDEINMAKNEAAAVLHAVLDQRRILEVPGYDKVSLDPAARFIATMNYGYAGTKELNEALVSRFLVIDMPEPDKETLERIIRYRFPDIRPEALVQFVGLFLDLQKKAANGEITTKVLDLRGMLSALGTIRAGLAPELAIRMGITNKTFDLFEKELVNDVVMTRLPASWTREDIFA